MRLPVTFCSLALMAAISGCGSVVIQSGPDGGAPPPDVPPATGDAPLVIDRPIAVLDRPIAVLDRPPVPVGCTSASDCAAGLACVGPEGCGVPWTCQPALGRPCTEDLAPFCGCDGVTFRGSSSCPARPYQHRGECTTAVDAGPAPGACRGNVDCAAGQQCVGPEGCGVPWNCRAVSGCARDLGSYCSCEGDTFMASSTCPGRPYLHRGACSATPDAGPRPDCPPDDARGVGMCTAFFGYAWDGTRCVGLGGCSCQGSACGSLAFSLELCNYNHRACL